MARLVAWGRRWPEVEQGTLHAAGGDSEAAREPGAWLEIERGPVFLSGKRQKHVPLRTCIACQQQRAKRELIRVVRTPEGCVEIDLRGKKPGRGAYICRRQECWQAGIETGKLERVLKCRVQAEEIAALRLLVGSLVEGYSAVEPGKIAPGTGREQCKQGPDSFPGGR